MDYADFARLVRERSREIAPDYPNIQSDLEPWEHLWAITSSYEGTAAANNDLHEFLAFLRAQLGWTVEEMVDRWREFKQREAP